MAKKHTWKIKGSCESCGFGYEGAIENDSSAFPEVYCPDCLNETQNFDEAHIVDENDKIEHYNIVYKQVDLSKPLGVCSICGGDYHGFGNNAQPINKKRCCDDCNSLKVIPARLKRVRAGVSAY